MLCPGQLQCIGAAAAGNGLFQQLQLFYHRFSVYLLGNIEIQWSVNVDRLNVRGHYKSGVLAYYIAVVDQILPSDDSDTEIEGHHVRQVL